MARDPHVPPSRSNSNFWRYPPPPGRPATRRERTTPDGRGHSHTAAAAGKRVRTGSTCSTQSGLPGPCTNGIEHQPRPPIHARGADRAAPRCDILGDADLHPGLHVASHQPRRVSPCREGFNRRSDISRCDDPRGGLSQVVSHVNDLHLEQVDAETKGDLFEHVLRQIRQAGELGQFRTPRHVIRALVQLVDPRLGETVHDPAAGTAGFLVGAYDHIRLANSSAAGIEEIEADGKTVLRGLGDTLSRAAVRRLHEATLYGTDVDPRMVRLATMNLSLRGLDRVRILRRDALTRSLNRSAKAELGLPVQGFDVVLANPPFSGRLDPDRIVEDVKIGRTRQTELLFLQYMLIHLKDGGQCGVVVPEGVLFGPTGAHRELRRKLVENNCVDAVLSLPGGVFNPYSGVKTSVLVFRKGGATDRVMFLHADNDGFKLDANHDTPVAADDLPGLVSAFRDRDARWTA